MAHVREVEITAKSVQSALHPIMVVLIDGNHDLLEERQ
jgi:hypothetical protein